MSPHGLCGAPQFSVGELTSPPAPHPAPAQGLSSFVGGNDLGSLCVQKVRGAPLRERTLGYLVRYFPENSTHLAQTANTTDQHLELHLGGEPYQVSVVSYNSLGRCPAATLRVPAVAEERECRPRRWRGAPVLSRGRRFS